MRNKKKVLTMWTGDITLNLCPRKRVTVLVASLLIRLRWNCAEMVPLVGILRAVPAKNWKWCERKKKRKRQEEGGGGALYRHLLKQSTRPGTLRNRTEVDE